MDGQPYRIKEYYLFQIQTNYNKITCDSKNLNIKYMIDEVTILKTVHIYCSRHYTYLAFPRWIFTGIHLYAKGQSRVRHAWYALFSSVAPTGIEKGRVQPFPAVIHKGRVQPFHAVIHKGRVQLLPRNTITVEVVVQYTTVINTQQALHTVLHILLHLL